MLTLKHITFSYGQQSVLRDITLSLEPGLVHGLLGPNGAGKTTIFEVIGCNLQKQKGSIRYKGSKPSAKTIAYQPTDPYFYTLITGREYLRLHQFQNPDFRIDEWNKIFELPLDDLIESYSSGMKKRQSIMAMICLDRPVMLFDEPFNNLDLEANQFLMRLLRMIAKKEKVVLISSHFLEVMTTVSDRIYLLSNGNITDTVERANFVKLKEKYASVKAEEAANLASKLL